MRGNKSNMNISQEDERANDYVDINIFVDESGTITDTNINSNKFFLISLIITADKKKLISRFRTCNSKLANKYPKHAKELKENKEIKGSDIEEIRKKDFYESFIKNESGNFEIGIIALDNSYTSSALCSVKARCFNYLIQEYLNNFFRKHSKYNKCIRNINITIDERSVKKEAKNHLKEYLLQHLNTFYPLWTDNINVNYVDSKKHELVQFSDYVANTFYRSLLNKKEGIENVRVLSSILCNGRIYNFPLEHNTPKTQIKIEK